MARQSIKRVSLITGQERGMEMDPESLTLDQRVFLKTGCTREELYQYFKVLTHGNQKEEE